MSKLSAALAAAALVISPIAVQAGTRAESSPVYAQANAAQMDDGENHHARRPAGWLFGSLGLVAILLLVLASGGGNGKTRGG